ncbi:Flp pilus assembly protein TadG [Catenulispora sp. EB89]|uniref:TadE family protein n=1 Tax=Catenulispora sp. EB89 TaxID=3156257 RepID=UPI003512D95B
MSRRAHHARRPGRAHAPACARARDAGVSSVEVVLMAPLIVMLILLIVSLGVLVNVRSEVEGAARDAARAGSLQGTGQDAMTQAQAAADADLGNRCQGSATVTSAYVPPVADGGGYYKVTVACTVDMSGFGVFGAHQTFSQTFAAPIDPLQNFHPGPVPTSTAPGPQPTTTTPSPTSTQFSAPTWLTPSLPTGGITITTTIGGPPTPTPPAPTPTGTTQGPTPPTPTGTGTGTGTGTDNPTKPSTTAPTTSPPTKPAGH